jgi:hypothetical protein
MSRESQRQARERKQQVLRIQRENQKRQREELAKRQADESKALAFADRVALAGVVIGLSGAVAALAFPLAYPDLVSVHTWRVVLGISLTILAVSVARLIYDIAREIRVSRDRGSRKKWLTIFSIIFGISAWYLWPKDEMDQQLPGFGGYAVLRIFDTPASNRKYVFNVGSDEGAKVAFYISASDLFTLSLTDVHGESYSLESPISANKIPLHDFVALFCEVGITDDTTILRIVVNGREIQRRTLPFVINLGDRKWKNVSIGGAPLEFTEYGIRDMTFSNEKIQALVENVRGAFHQPFR